MMLKLIGASLLSFAFSFILAIPFINLLFKLKFKDSAKLSIDFKGHPTLFNQLHGGKVGTPTGGGILIIVSSAIFTALIYVFTKFHFNDTSFILYFSMVSFGLLGFYDDLRKFFGKSAPGALKMLRLPHKLALQIILGLVIGFLLFTRIGLHTLWLPLLGIFDLGYLYIPFAAIVVIATTNAFNITDGLDGLASGLLMIALIPFWYLSSSSALSGDIGLFIAVIIGSLAAFLYFNIFPARVFMGDTGALALGAMLATIALLSGHPVVLIVIGGIFVVEAVSSLLQWGSMITRNKKIFLIAPIHHHFEALGWPETKVTMRFWLAGIYLALLGIFVSLL
ncbi:MAG: phospho-N-acetylmuramoyl-pentapeptide-transferase [candidate division WWE3 bacterium]|nr:phospho-N-acetylmuramoyl-pentapeptide-transferase [candidate division WWE3 bacterium]